MRFTWPQSQIKNIVERAQTSTVEIKLSGEYAAKCLRLAIYKYPKRKAPNLAEVSCVLYPTEDEDVVKLLVYRRRQETLNVAV